MASAASYHVPASPLATASAEEGGPASTKAVFRATRRREAHFMLLVRISVATGVASEGGVGEVGEKRKEGRIDGERKFVAARTWRLRARVR